MNNNNCVPNATKKRMVQLLQLLNTWTAEKITSVEISSATGWKDSLIRRDFWLLGADLKGVSNGYYVSDLKSVISKKLNIEIDSEQIQKKHCCIVGLSRLGAALLDESLLDENIFVIKAGFDSNVNRVEILRSVYPLYPAVEMEWVIKREKIEYAVLTVPDKDAQNMANRLIKAGIKGIVNMTNRVLIVPKEIKIENISILNALKLVI